MRIIDPGHKYKLKNFREGEQDLVFLKRSGGAVEYDVEWDGLQTQEVLRALIDRTIYLNNILPCKETELAIKHLRMALYWYEVRAYRRKKQKVNRKAENHLACQDDFCEYDKDFPFTEENIELKDIAEDGHIIV